MQNFVNNWSSEVTLSPGATSLAVSLPDGTYRLTLSDALGQEATRWEIVEAAVSGGIAALTRGIEGTEAQDWPEGSVAYIAVTAGTMNDMLAGLDDAASRAAEALLIAEEALQGGSPRTYIHMPNYGSVEVSASLGLVKLGIDGLAPGGGFSLIMPPLGRSEMIEFSVSTIGAADALLAFMGPPGKFMSLSVTGPDIGASSYSGGVSLTLQRLELRVRYCVPSYSDTPALDILVLYSELA